MYAGIYHESWIHEWFNYARIVNRMGPVWVGKWAKRPSGCCWVISAVLFTTNPGEDGSMLPWCGFVFKYGSLRLDKSAHHMLNPSKTGCMSRPWGIIHRGENSDSKTFKDQEKKHQTPCSLREFSWNSWLSLIHFWLPKSLQKHISGLIRPSAPSMRRKICASRSGHMQPIHRQYPWVGKSPMVWKIIVPCALPLEILLPNPLFWMGFHVKAWEGLSLPNPNIIFSSKRQVSGKNYSGLGAAWRLKTYSDSKNLMFFFDAPRAPSLGMEHDSITKTSLYITKLGYLAKI